MNNFISEYMCTISIYAKKYNIIKGTDIMPSAASTAVTINSLHGDLLSSVTLDYVLGYPVEEN